MNIIPSNLTFTPGTGASIDGASSLPLGLGTEVLNNLLNVLGSLLDGTQRLIEEHGAALLISIATLVLAWIAATVLRGLTTKLLRAVGLDLVAERTGLRAFLARHEIGTPPSKAAGWLLYFVIIYTALIAVFERLGLDTAGQLLRSVAGYVPQILAAGLLIVLGLFLGKWADILVSRAARVMGMPGHKMLGVGARFAVLLLAAVFALNSLGWVSSTLLLWGLAIVLGSGLAAILLFSICARGLAESMLARGFLTTLYKAGDRIRIDGVEGVLLKIEPCSVRLDCGDRVVVLPNRMLTARKVEILKSAPDATSATPKSLP